MDDLQQLVTRAQRGDLEAFGWLVERFQAMARAIAYTMVGDRHLAEDVAQEAFAEAYFCLPNLREPVAFAAWLRKIVFKHGDRLTRIRSVATVPLDWASSAPTGAEDDPARLAESRALQEQVRAAIAVLPDPDRSIVTLFYIAGYPQREIAVLLDVPIGTVKKRLFQARQRLRTHFDTLMRERLYEQWPDGAARFTRAVTFFLAVRLGDLASVVAHLASDPELVHAYEHYDKATARKHGLPIAATFTALHRAVFSNDTRMLACLLDHGGDIDARTRSASTPLHTAVLLDHRATFELLLTRGANPCVSDARGLTPLHLAAMRSRHSLAVRLLEAGADAGARDHYGRSPFDWAIIRGDEDMAELLRSQERKRHEPTPV